MTHFIRNHQFGSLVVVLTGFLVAIVIAAKTTQNHPAVTKVHLIPAATIYRAAPTGGGPTWGGETWVPSPFRRAQLHHPWCGRRISPQIRGIHGIYRMWFARCAMAFGPIKVYRLPVATPLPEQSVVGGILGGTATPIPPTAVPVATPAPPVSSAVDQELGLMNATRAAAGIFPLTLNEVQSNGTGTCVGSYGHALHMASVGQISHDQFPADICVAANAAGENVGESGGSVTFALQTIHNLMMSEPHSPGCTGNHACNVLSSVYRQVGIGVVTTSSGTYLAVDFLS